MTQPASQFVPAAWSVLDTNALATELQARYPLATPASCELLKAGVNDTYLVRTASGLGVYRLYQLNWRSEAAVAWELALLAHLGAQDIPVSSARPDQTGALHHWLLTPEGPRIGALFDFAPGQPPPFEDAEQGAEQARAFGASVARLHDAMQTFEQPAGRPPLDLVHLIDEPLAQVLPLLEGRPDDAAYLADLAQRTRAQLAELAGAGLTRIVCHGDLHGGNVHLHGGVLTHFDFDCGGPGWLAYDLAVFWWDNRLNTKSPELWPAFLAGYGPARLAPVDHAALPWFVVARTIWLLGLQVGFRRRFGAAFFSGPAYWQEFFNFLRAWEATELVGHQR